MHAALRGVVINRIALVARPLRVILILALCLIDQSPMVRDVTGQGPLGARAASLPALPPITSPLQVLAANTHYFTDGSGRAIYLTGSHTWDDLQDMSQSTTPAPFDFTSYVSFLQAHGQNMTILWHKDLPTYCNWGAGGTWHMTPFPWLRTGPGTATDGLPKFDLTQFNQAYFDRLRARVQVLDQHNIYATVQLFDGLGLLNNRCATDGYPFSGANNVNGVDDGGGTGSMTMTAPNAITSYQDAYVTKVIDSLNDLPNVLWEVSEEAPSASTWWQAHMIALIHTYEASKLLQHPVGYPMLTGGADATLFASAADWVAPSAKLAPTSNQGKVIVNDSDHSYYGMWNDSAQTNRNYLWENFTTGASVLFMDPYEVAWSSGNRNLCPSPVNGVCSGVDPRWDNFRDNLGYTLSYANKMNLAAMTPQGSLSSTGYALANRAAVGAAFLVYAPTGGSFSVNLASTTRSLNVEWFNPATGSTTEAGAVRGGASAQAFSPPFSGDAVLYLVDAGATATPTALPANTATATPQPPTATYSATATAVPPTPTSTASPTETNTAIPATSTATATSSPTPSTTSTTITLAAGWNLIALPLVPASPLDAQTVLTSLIGNTHGNYAEIDSYTNGQFTPSLYDDPGDNLGIGGKNFTLQVGQGYALYTDTAGSITLTGTPVAATTGLSLAPGWNLVGFPDANTTTYKADDVLTQLLGSTKGSYAEIDSYRNGQFSPSAYDAPGDNLGLGGSNFSMQQGQGYALYTDKPVALTL